VVGYAVAGLQVSGTFSATVTFEGTVDGTNWVGVPATNRNDGAAATTATAAGLFLVNCSGLQQLRARVSSYASGSVTVVGFGLAGGVVDTLDRIRSGDVNNLASAAGLLDALMVGRYDASLPTLTSGRFSTPQLNQRGLLYAHPVDATGDAADYGVGYTSADGISNSTVTAPSAVFNIRYNGASWDRERNNLEGTLLASAARTTTTNSADQTNHNGRGVLVFVNVTAVTSSPSVTVAIQEKDPISGTYTAILTSAAITGPGHTVLAVYPGVTVAANVAASHPLPRTWRVAVTHGNADSITYSVGYALIG
jgi:hypothetical protein